MKNAGREVDYRLAKWILRNMEKHDLIDPAELQAIWSDLIATYDPPTKSIETVAESIRGDQIG